MTETPETTPTTTPTTTTAVARPTGPSPLRIAIVGGGLVAILAGAALAQAAGTGSPAGPSTAGSLSGSAGVLGGGLLDEDFAGGHGPGHGILGVGGITITAISGSSVSLKTDDGWTRTITVASRTTITKAGASIKVGDLKVGDEIRFQETRNDDGSYTIDAIAVVVPHVDGKVTAISGSTITVEQPDGTTATVKVSASTTYKVAGVSTAALADVKVGMFLRAEGTKNADGSLSASAVVAMAARTDGFGPGHRGHGWFDTDNDGSANGTTSG